MIRLCWESLYCLQSVRSVIAARFGSFSFNSDGTAGCSEVAQPVRTFTALSTSDIYLLYVLPTERDMFRMGFVISSDYFTTQY
jgi:hypothetical protein